MGLWDNNAPAASPAQSPTTEGMWATKPNPGTPAGAPAGTASQPAAPAVAAKGISRDDYWANKEARDLEKERVYREEDIPAIRRTSAYSAAATLAAAALAGDALSFGSAAKGKRLDMYLGYVDLIAGHVLAKLNGEDMVVPGDDVAEEAPAEVQEEVADLG